MYDIVFEDDWIQIIHKSDLPKTKVYEVWSKYSDCSLGLIKWHNAWRNYCFFPDTFDLLVFSDRCLLAIQQFVTKCNFQHRIQTNREKK